jgi:hypothetical protein
VGKKLKSSIENPLPRAFRYLAVFIAILSGWGTNCWPRAIPARFARVVAPYSCGDRAARAFDGR